VTEGKTTTTDIKAPVKVESESQDKNEQQTIYNKDAPFGQQAKDKQQSAR